MKPAYLFLAALMLVGCAEEAGDPTVYRTEAAAARNIIVAVESAGVIEPIALVEVKSKASGEILEVAVESGQRVPAGDLLVKIDQRVPHNTQAQATAGLEVARARLTNSEAQLRRIQKLFSAASVSEVDREAAQLEVANAKAEVVRSEVALENAKIAMEDTVVSAPITGTVLEQLVEPGQVISSPGQDVGGGTLLMRMADLTRVRVRALVDETDIGKVSADMPAKVTVAAYPNRTFEGRVLKVEPQAAAVQNVTMFPVLVELDNENALLKPGMNADVSLDIARRIGVLAIPVAALRTEGDAIEAAELVGIDAGVVIDTIREAAGTRGHDAVVADDDTTMLTPRERLREIRAKRQRGELLTDEERSLLADARAQYQSSGGRGGGGGGGGPRPGGGGTGGGSGGGGAPAGGTGGGSAVAAPAPPGAETVDPFAAARRRSALDSQFGGRYVVFVDEDGAIAPRVIEAGVTDLDYSEVLSGLEAGENVLLLPSASLVRAQGGIRDRLMGRMSSALPGGGGAPR